jgi:hypothetical protein
MSAGELRKNIGKSCLEVVNLGQSHALTQEKTVVELSLALVTPLS